MVVSPPQPPRAPPDHLRLQSFQILSRLRLINEFQPWLEYTRYHIFRKHHTPLELLWDCFAFGAPLGTLLTLLGSPAPIHLVTHVEDFDFGIGIAEREEYFVSFIARVQALEMQGRLSYGEVLRCDDFLSGTNSAFTKVLRTVYRILIALEGTYPGLFNLPRGSEVKRENMVQKLLESEHEHILVLKSVMQAAASLSGSLAVMEPCLECLNVNHVRLLQYHENLYEAISDIALKSSPEYWDRIFSLDNDLIRTRVFSAYRSICVNYSGLVNFLETTEFEPNMTSNAQLLLENVSNILFRVSEYCDALQDILSVTIPTMTTYNALCEAVFRLHGISENMDEVGMQLRTMHSSRILKGRAYIWNAPDPDDMGAILLDDCLVDSVKGVEYSVFLFETLFLCCREGPRVMEEPATQPPLYPIRPWEMGPALKRSTALDIVHAIPTSALKAVVATDAGCVEIDWVNENNELRTVAFCSMTEPQRDQWIFTLQVFVPSIYHLPLKSQDIFQDDEGSYSEDEGSDGIRLTHAKSWSVIGRKGPHSETSSFVLQVSNDDEFLFTPGLLPTLFGDMQGPPPLRLPSPPPDLSSDYGPAADLSAPVDLTGKITREGRFPSAHGGFSDVWKGVWHDGTCERNVAVKVLRSRMDDPEMEEKMIRRLRRELHVWKKLDHPNIVKLYSTASDFEHYSSMVCPWMDNGSISKYMEKSGDLMSVPDRLKLLCEVMDGLSYLHSCSIVHGDLTGPNILINEAGNACLGDFGLSTLVVEFRGTSYFTSTMGGAVRWADALLYYTPTKDSTPYEVGTWSDIYSFGSVMLEVLSGRIPFHYIRGDAQVVIELNMGNKPRRPAHPFVTDEQWSLIQDCWADDIEHRPDARMVSHKIQSLHKISLGLL